MAYEDLLLSSRAPDRNHIRKALLVAMLLVAAFLASLPFRRAGLPHVNAFIPVVDTMLLLGDMLTAALLFAQAAVVRSRALIALATGYFFTGLIIVPHALTFPGAFAPAG